MRKGDRMTDAELLARFHNSRNVPESSQLLGFHLLRVDQAAGVAEVQFQARPEFRNSVGHIQGGFLTAMLDECTTIAGLVASEMTSAFPTLEMKTSFLRPVRVGPVRGVGRVLRRGRTITFLEGELFDTEGKLAATASVTTLPQPFKASRAAATAETSA
jgi:uncharacterized protein (TIGR00369 family)